MKIALVLVALALAVAIGFAIGKRHARRLQRARRIRIDRFKLKRQHADIELDVFASREVVDAVREYAKQHHVSTEEAMRQAKMYLREIVPKFNLLAYYRFGAPIARAIVYFLYRCVVDRTPIVRFNSQAPKGSVVVYVINHRSNADYVLVAHMLFKFISLSYAVGEWARVWPLNHLFKWFGAYFIRRRYREPLYHAVLSNFVRTITRNGVTQGIFIEGGLSRDGAFGKPKLGMLDYIVTAKRDEGFTAPLFLIPTAINYDRVLEDRVLTEEMSGREDRSSNIERLNTTLEFVFKNALRGLLKRFRHYGYAVVTFGEPICVDDFVRDHPRLLSATFEERKPELRTLGEAVMERISAALPLTPVTLAAAVFAGSKSEVLSEEQVAGAIDALRGTLQARPLLLREQSAPEIWSRAKIVLQLRRLIQENEHGWRWNPEELPLRDYYANSLVPFEEVRRGWGRPETVANGAGGALATTARSAS